MRKGIKGLYLLMINAALFLMVAAFASKNTSSNTPHIFNIEPTKVQKESEEVTSYIYNIHGTDIAGQGIAFFTSHQNVVVYCDRARIYEAQKTDSVWGHTPGNLWNFVHIPYGTQSIKISLEKSKMNNVKMKQEASDYVRHDKVMITDSRDIFLYRTINRRLRPKENSSTHRSSSGRVHGGRGGKF